ESDKDANDWVLNRFNNNFGQHGYAFSTDGAGLYENVNVSGLTDGIENREGKYFDWEDALFRTGIYQTNDLSVSGATDNTNYYSDRKSTRLNSSHVSISYAVFCLEKNIINAHLKSEDHNQTKREKVLCV